MQLGKEAAELAIALIEQEVAGPDRRMLPVELVVRDSTAKKATRRGVLAVAKTLEEETHGINRRRNQGG